MKGKHIKSLFLSMSTITVVLFVLLAACTTEAPVPTQEAAAAAVMEKIEEANAAWASGNPLGFFDNVAEDIVWIDDIEVSKRVVGREALKPYLEGYIGVVPPHQHELYDFHLQYYGDIVIASYYYQGTIEGEKAPPWKAISIYHYSDGDWYSVLENWSVVTEEAPAEEAVETEEESTDNAVE